MVTVLTCVPGANPTFAPLLRKKEEGELPVGQHTHAELIRTSRPAYLLINERGRNGRRCKDGGASPGIASPLYNRMMMRWTRKRGGGFVGSR